MATTAEAFALAVQQHHAGHPDIASQLYHKILTVDPNHFDALHLLGVVALQERRYQEAVELIGRAIRQNENVANFHNNLGEAYLGLYQIPAAIASYRRALELNPDYAVAHSNLGNALREQRKLNDAIVSYRRAIELQPDLAAAHNNLGNALMVAGKLADANACCRRSLELRPDDVDAHNNLGQVLQEEGQFAEALAWYRRGLQLDPNSARIQYSLGRLYHELRQGTNALRHYDQSLKLAPQFAEAHHGKGLSLHDLGDLDSALQHHLEALRHRPDFAPAHCGVGVVRQEQGELMAAENSFREALRHDPDWIDAHAQLATLLRNKLPEVDLVAMRRLSARSRRIDGKYADLLFGLAHVDDAKGDYALAAGELCQANAMVLADRRRRGQQYDPGEHDQFVSQLIQNFDPTFFDRVRKFGHVTERPVFIMGLPRSGTTLIEQILAGHSQVFAAGEWGLIGSVLASLPQRLSRNATAVECVPDLDARRIDEIAREAVECMNTRNSTALRLTDKLPDNYLYAGLIAALFPHAKIIHCRRELRDVAVSCWMTNFRQIHWSNKFEHIASRFRAYERIMAHWNQNLPMPILDIDYERTVADLEGTARRLIEWCGLEWQPSCVNFFEKRRPVRTASATQVRQPVYTKSVGRWRHYEQSLSRLFTLLPDPHVELR